MVRLVSGPQKADPVEIGVWSIYAAIAFGLFLILFFVILSILHYSVMMVALGVTVVLSYFAYLYFGPDQSDNPFDTLKGNLDTKQQEID